MGGKRSPELGLDRLAVTHDKPSNGMATPRPRAYFGLPKRLFDLTFAIMLLPVAAPLIVLLWLIVRLDGGPGFYGHRRVGRGGQTFVCYKLRSMVPDANDRLQAHLEQNPDAAILWQTHFKLDDDPRITRVGHFLRRSSLDELPQIWNVIKGEMSLVGPRPVTAPELVLYGVRAGYYKALRPGLTGKWQVSGRNSVSYERRVEMDEEYFHHGSLWRDLIIILQTVRSVLRMTGG